MITINATELKENLGKYLDLSQDEEIYITKNGKVISKLSNPNQDRIEMVKSLIGVIKGGMSEEEAKEERVRDYEKIQ